MTIREFFESGEQLAIHCDTEEKAKVLLAAFEREWYEWCDNERYTENTRWTPYKEKTCYSNKHEFSGKEFYQCAGYKILDFEDIEMIE